LVSARITAHQPAQRKAFESVQADAKAQLVASEAARLARQAGESSLAALRAGTAAAAASGSDGFASAQVIQRSSSEGIAPEVVQAAYRIAADKLPAYGGTETGSDGYILIELLRVVPASAADLAKVLPNLSAQAARVAAQQDGLAAIESLKARFEVQRRLDRLEPKTGSAQ
jgi:peptidyl-prolyl cis-trans isomerase D